MYYWLMPFFYKNYLLNVPKYNYTSSVITWLFQLCDTLYLYSITLHYIYLSYFAEC